MNESAPCQFLLIDDHAMLRAGLRLILESTLPGVTIHEATSMAEASNLSLDRIDLVLLDIELPGLNGLEGMALLKRRWPSTPVVVITSHTESEARAMATLRGAAAFLLKSESPERMVAVIQTILNGEGDLIASAPGAAPLSQPPPLTARQCEVLEHLCQGHSNKIIGRQLGLSENTVRGHVAGLLAVLGVSSRSEAVAVARQRGLVR
jgi:DNA-binding NarL/FixJ family response regulator